MPFTGGKFPDFEIFRRTVQKEHIGKAVVPLIRDGVGIFFIRPVQRGGVCPQIAVAVTAPAVGGDDQISGGDPLLLDDDKIEYILRGIKQSEHIRIIRIGTRTPGVLPERITGKLVKILKKYSPLYLNIHFNHPDEFSPDTCRALKKLADAGIVLGSQTVLLKGVNDDPEVMRELMWKLLENRVKPYYIFQCDLIYGTEHFRTPLSKGIQIMESLRGWSSGMANPHFVIDLPGGGGKVPVTAEYLIRQEKSGNWYRNYCGEEYFYPETISGIDL